MAFPSTPSFSHPLSANSSFSTAHSRATTPSYPNLSYYARPLSVSSSFTLPSRSTTPSIYTRSLSADPRAPDLDNRAGFALLRSASCASLGEASSSATGGVKYSEYSAKHFLRSAKISLDFTLPPGAPTIGPMPVDWSYSNVIYFSRGNRVYHKNMGATDDMGQLCKLKDAHGDLRAIVAAGRDQPHVMALGTSKGFVQIWDVNAKSMVSTWSAKDVSTMKWNGRVLTVAGAKGSIRHFDTRIPERSKMKEQASKVNRHQSRICSMEWNSDGNLLASGDENGNIYCWDSRQDTPLHIGDLVHRRKKMQHPGAITVSLTSYFSLISKHPC